jgi:hypothetical protein
MHLSIRPVAPADEGSGLKKKKSRRATSATTDGADTDDVRHGSSSFSPTHSRVCSCLPDPSAGLLRRLHYLLISRCFATSPMLHYHDQVEGRSLLYVRSLCLPPLYYTTLSLFWNSFVLWLNRYGIVLLYFLTRSWAFPCGTNLRSSSDRTCVSAAHSSLTLTLTQFRASDVRSVHRSDGEVTYHGL